MQTHEQPRSTPPRIFAMHGVVGAVNPSWLSHRNFLPKEKFEHHLKTRMTQYGDLHSAISHKGDALTIDDATYAAYDAAILARKYGHKVTLFVNPHNVINRSVYFFAWLCLIIDRAAVGSAVFLGQEFNLKDFNGRLALRQRVKQEYMAMAREQDRCECVENLARTLKVEDFSAPRFFQTLDEQALFELSKLGVEIGNHGWTHASPDALPPASAREEITKARCWIEEKFAVNADVYAAPFGLSRPAFPLEPELCRIWFMNDGALPADYVDEKIYNRKTLKL